MHRRLFLGTLAGAACAAGAKKAISDSPSRWLKTFTRTCGGAGTSAITTSSAWVASSPSSVSVLSSRQTK